MKMFKHMFLALALLPLFFATGCRTNAPVALLSFRLFHIGPDSMETGIYIDWQNTSKDKTIDSLILSLSDPQNSTLNFFLQLQEAEGVAPHCHNSRNIVVIYLPELTSAESSTLSLSLNQVNFTDGTFWETDETLEAIPANIDVQADGDRFPVELKQALFYEKSAHPSKVAPLPFQADWTSLLESDSIIGITYKIIAKTADGTVITDASGNGITYVSQFYEDSQQWVTPYSKNKTIMGSISDSSAVSTFRENGAARFELSICRCIDSFGRVWENESETPPIHTVLLGKKGYSFLQEAPSQSIATLIERIALEFSRVGIELISPAVFIEDGSFCVLRYEDVDVRVELSADNEVLPDSVAFVYYSVRQFTDFENYVQSVIDRMDLLRHCICPAVLTDLRTSDLAQTMDEYSIEDHLNNPSGQVQINGDSYEVFEEVSNILDERSNIVLCDIFAIGRELNYGSDAFFWVRESPYSEQSP